MDLVGTPLHLFAGDVILLRNIGKACLHPLLHLALPHVAPVLGRPDQVREGIGDGMGCAAQDHGAIVHPHASWQAALPPPCHDAHSPPPQAAGQPERFSRKEGVIWQR